MISQQRHGLIDSKMNGGIYVIRNIVNSKAYLGSAIDINKRIGEHLRALRNGTHHNIHLQRAWNKYGRGVFEFKILLYCNPEELLSNEQDGIDYYTELLGWAGLYNICPTAGSSLGLKASMETRAKLSASHKGKTSGRKGKKNSPEHRAKLSASHMGKKLSLAARAKISANHRKENTPGQFAKFSATMKGRKRGPHSPEWRAKLSAANMGHEVSAETRAKISAGNKGRTFPPCSPERKAKISMALKGRELSSEHKANLSAGHKKCRSAL